MSHKQLTFSRRGSAGNPVVLHRENPAAFRALRIRNLSDAQMSIAARYTDDVSKWDSLLPEYDPVTVVTGTNDKLDFDEGAAELNAVVAAGTYATPILLSAAIQTALRAVGSSTLEVMWNHYLKKFTIRSETTLNILWKTGVNGSDNADISIAADLGFNDVADDSGVRTYQSDNAVGTLASWTHALVAPVSIITGTNDKIDFNEGVGELTATVAAGTYATAEALVVAVAAALNAAAVAAITVGYSATTRKATITSAGGTFELPWATGTNNAISAASDLGFSAVDLSGAVSYVSQVALPSSTFGVNSGAFRDDDLPSEGCILELSTVAGIFEVYILDNQNTTDASQE